MWLKSANIENNVFMYKLNLHMLDVEPQASSVFKIKCYTVKRNVNIGCYVDGRKGQNKSPNLNGKITENPK